MDDDESRPLTASTTEDYGSRNTVEATKGEEPPPSYDSTIRNNQQSTDGQRYNLFGGISSQADFRSSLYETHTPITGQYVTCRVCQSQLDVTGKRDQFVVKCIFCNEATPIQNAPAGKKYVRCPCHCLLVCKISSQRIACPRADCKRIINLGTSPITPPVPSGSGDVQRVTCIHCNMVFLFRTLSNKLARCPHCKKVSTVSPSYSRIRGYFYLCIGIILLLLSVFITLKSYDHIEGRWIFYVLYAGMYFSTIWMFWQSQYYFCMKVSTVMEEMESP